MTVDAQFCCIPRDWRGYGDADRPRSPRPENGMKPGRGAVTGSSKTHHAAGALRETTQSRSHDPTAQPHR